MRFLAIGLATTFIVASPTIGQDTMVPLPKRQAYHSNGESVTKDTPSLKKKPPNVDEVRKAAGYDARTSSKPRSTNSDLSICCVIPIAVLFTSPVWIVLLAGWCAAFSKRRPRDDTNLSVSVGVWW